MVRNDERMLGKYVRVSIASSVVGMEWRLNKHITGHFRGKQRELEEKRELSDKMRKLALSKTFFYIEIIIEIR